MSEPELIERLMQMKHKVSHFESEIFYPTWQLTDSSLCMSSLKWVLSQRMLRGVKCVHTHNWMGQLGGHELFKYNPDKQFRGPLQILPDRAK